MDKWIEINVNAVKRNLEAVQAALGDQTRLIAVLKANGYGHGIEQTARILSQHGVEYFAVSFLEEAIQLRETGINSDILVFSPIINEADAEQAVRSQLTLTIASQKDQEILASVCSQLNEQVKVHLKIDTGLGRFGLDEKGALLVCQKIASQRWLQMEGIYTHFADPSSPAYTEKQFRAFMQAVSRLKTADFTFPIQHVANSAVFLRSPEMHLDAVRIGTLLSGQHPVGSFPLQLKLEDPYKFKSRIISLQTREEGSFLGYYRTHRLKRTAQIAVIPVGFHDGLAVEVANRPVGFIDMLKKIAKVILNYLDWPGYNLQVKIKGQSYPIRGKVFMQMALVEIPTGAEVRVGDEVELPVRKTLAAPGIPRVYVEAGTTPDQMGG